MGAEPARQARRETLSRFVRHDLPASLVVFLVAVPLSLGIASASGAPVAAGLVAAVVGGIVAGALGGSRVQVSGPAAGLVVVVAGLVAEFGWAVTCAITVAAGLLQLVLGACRVARVALALSPAIVHGMLAGIGATIALAQLHVVLGGEPQSEALQNVRELPGQLADLDHGAVLVGLAVIAVLLAYPRLPRRVRVVPGPLVAVTLATVGALAFGLDVATVDLPRSLLDAVALPALPGADQYLAFAVAVLTVTAIASVESLLSATAADRQRPGLRTDLDRELVGQGAANAVSGMLGGLPVTGVIVRTSANIAAGARSRASAVLHGVWVLVFAALLTGLIERIPMAALAGLLVVVGVQLVKVSDIKRLHAHRELPVYVTTAVGVLALNLLEGVLAGLALAVVLVLVRVVRARVRAERGDADGPWTVVVEGTLSFLALPRLSRVLARIPAGSAVELELATDFLDHAAYDHLHAWIAQHEAAGGTVRVTEAGPAALRAERRPWRRVPVPLLPRWFSPWATWQAQHDPDAPAEPADIAEGAAGHPAALRPLYAGVRDYHRRSAPHVRSVLDGLDGRHEPQALFLTCADARIVPNVITSSGPGDLFTVRNIGNLVPPAGSGESSVAASLHYAVETLRVPTAFVCGHSSCGCMHALLAGAAGVAGVAGDGSTGGDALARWLRVGLPSLEAWRAGHPLGLAAAAEGRDPADQLAMVNVALQVAALRDAPAARAAVAAGRLWVRGLYFDLPTATLLVLDEEQHRFRPLEQADLAAATSSP